MTTYYDYDRDYLGRIVREVWIAWAKEQPTPKTSWLVPYDQLSETDKEVDRRIGERLFHAGVTSSLQFRTAEELFRDKDIFLNYIADKVNPSRLKEGLSVISTWQANVCYDVIMSRRYR